MVGSAKVAGSFKNEDVTDVSMKGTVQKQADKIGTHYSINLCVCLRVYDGCIWPSDPA